MSQSLTDRLKEKLAFDETTVAIDAGFHAGDIKQLHATECPALLEFANRIVKAEHGRLSPILTQLIACMEALGDLEFECRNAHIEEQHVVYEMANAAKSLANLQKELEK